MTCLHRLSLWDEMVALTSAHPAMISIGSYVQLIAMHAAKKEFQQAELCLFKIKHTKEDHFRFYAPLLSAYCQHDPAKAFELFSCLPAHKILPTESAVCELLNTNLTPAQRIAVSDLVHSEFDAVTSSIWGFPTSIADNGKCSSCSALLAKVDISSSAKQEIMQSLCGSVKLDQEYKYNVVIDGANVGFFENHGNTQAINVQQINKVLRMLPSSFQPIVVLHKRHTRHFRSIKAQVVQSPGGKNDDLYWLALVLANDCLVVTNDEMKDHAWAALKQKEFQRWKSIHVIRFTNSSLLMPSPYTRCIQKAGGNWHYPTTDGKWLCDLEQTQ